MQAIERKEKIKPVESTFLKNSAGLLSSVMKLGLVRDFEHLLQIAGEL